MFLGKTATYATVFSQLIAADGQNHGLHGFIVPIRDPKTLQPLTGVTVGDMGEKAGLNGIDNGFLIFNFYRIPKENLLNKTGDVDIDGNYQTSFKNPQQILGKYSLISWPPLFSFFNCFFRSCFGKFIGGTSSYCSGIYKHPLLCYDCCCSLCSGPETIWTQTGHRAAVA